MTLFEISIHALREEGDEWQDKLIAFVQQFLSTPSARRATQRIPDDLFLVRDFYPRPPRGGRRSNVSFGTSGGYFYPRPPRGGRLPNGCFCANFASISIHALREEGDQSELLYPTASRDFYPRPPRGGRPAQSSRRRRASRISIHALREEGDLSSRPVVPSTCQFLSTPSARRATLQGRGNPSPC